MAGEPGPASCRKQTSEHKHPHAPFSPSSPSPREEKRGSVSEWREQHMHRYENHQEQATRQVPGLTPAPSQFWMGRSRSSDAPVPSSLMRLAPHFEAPWQKYYLRESRRQTCWKERGSCEIKCDHLSQRLHYFILITTMLLLPSHCATALT